jgi:hypothetical protein
MISLVQLSESTSPDAAVEHLRRILYDQAHAAEWYGHGDAERVVALADRMASVAADLVYVEASDPRGERHADFADRLMVVLLEAADTAISAEIKKLTMDN